MTPDQIRARLRAEGYPEGLLDSYLGSASGGASAGGGMLGGGVAGAGAFGGTAPGQITVTQDVLTAARSLGIMDASDSLYMGTAGGFGTMGGNGFMVDSFALDSINQIRRAREAQADTGIFGLSLFQRRTSQFDPNLAGAVDASYKLGAGDRLVLLLTGDVEQAYTLDVTREGFVIIPTVGQVYVANLTLGQLDDLLYSRLARVYSGVGRGPGATTRFSVSVSRLRSNQVFVTGEVARPGSYRVSAAGTALTALYAAGGPNVNGSLRRVEVRRGGRTVGSLDVYDYLLRGDAGNDVRLESGDVLFVPVHGPRVRVVGEVLRPATYELKAGESLADAIRAAGGFNETAARNRVQIERILPPSQRGTGGRDRVVVDIAADQFADGAPPAFPLSAGDVVHVFPIAERVRNRVSVLGSVWAPGTQGFSGTLMLSDALRRAGGLKPDAYLGRVLITRLQPDSTQIQLHAQLADTMGHVVNDLALREDDQIRVFSVTEFRPERYVAVSGAVRNSGRYPFREGMTMRDLVLMAGGLAESADLREAEIARLPENRANGATATTFRAPLDSTYLFERGPDGKYLGPPGIAAPANPSAEVPLEPYDNVLVLRQPNWELQRTVVIDGEVRFPGRYTLTRKDERLSDLIKRAGGFTAQAYDAGITFTRAKDGLGRIGLDVPAVLKNTKHNDNLVLLDGDSVRVPAFEAVVNVKGAVNSPVAVAYVRGADLYYYLRAAGGPSRKADVGRSYVTQASGKVESLYKRALLPDRVPRPGPGSQVLVPERDPNDKPNYLGIISATAQLLGAAVGIVAILAARRN